MPRRSPLTSVMPALSIATSVPVPMAMPTSACGERRRVVDAVAGHRHHAPCACSDLNALDFVLGQHLRRRTRRCPSFAGDGFAVLRVSPVQHDHFDARVVQGLDRLRASFP